MVHALIPGNYDKLISILFMRTISEIMKQILETYIVNVARDSRVCRSLAFFSAVRIAKQE